MPMPFFVTKKSYPGFSVNPEKYFFEKKLHKFE